MKFVVSRKSDLQKIEGISDSPSGTIHVWVVQLELEGEAPPTHPIGWLGRRSAGAVVPGATRSDHPTIATFRNYIHAVGIPTFDAVAGL